MAGEATSGVRPIREALTEGACYAVVEKEGCGEASATKPRMQPGGYIHLQVRAAIHRTPGRDLMHVSLG